MSDVAIVDYGLCNLDSVRRAVEECGARATVTVSPGDVLTATHVILPGVGAFPEAMANLRAAGLVDALNRRVRDQGAPFLGICLGMQLMASGSTEGRDTEGLGWIEGQVVRLEHEEGARVPHVGWDEVGLAKSEPLFAEVPDRSDFYFVHSYVMRPVNQSDVLGQTAHGSSLFTSAVSRGNLLGVQFHPEKSQRMGARILRNFLQRCEPGGRA